MTDGIEIYIRPSGDQTLLNIYVPIKVRERFIRALRDGAFSDAQVPIEFEVTTLPKWITDDDQRKKALRTNESVHVRIPLDVINIHSTE